MSNSSITDFLIPSITKYRLSEELGSGAYGVVYKGLREDDGKNIALKRIYITDKDGNNNIPLSTHRELGALRKLNALENRNIVKLFDVILNNIEGKMCVDLIFELGDFDLEKYLKKFNSFGDMPLAKIINLSKQLLNAIWFMHSHCVIHRDLKPANILINRDGTDLKVTDFGLARILGFDSSLTPVVVTLWYRSPEILLQRSYLTACDVWSAGCIIAEMVYGKPVFAGDNELSQIEKIVTRLGMEAIDNWPQDNIIVASSLRSLIDKSRSLEIVLKRADQAFVKLIKELLRFDPEKRILSNDAYRKLDSLSGSYGPNCSSSSNISTSSADAANTNTNNCKEWEIDNEMIVKSVVRNVLDEDEDEEDKEEQHEEEGLHIPGIIGYNEPINCYPHEEIEIEDGNETETDSCSETESCEEQFENGIISVTKEPEETGGNSFSSYRSSQNNCSFSSHAHSSPNAADTITTSDDDHYEEEERTKCKYSHDIAELAEFKEKFNETVIRDDVETIEITSSDEEEEDNEETCSASEPSPPPSMLRVKSQQLIDNSLPFLMTRHNSDRIYSTPFKELNDNNRLLRSCSIPPKEQFVRKRLLHPEDDSGDSENEFAHFSPIAPSVEQLKPLNLFRQKSLRRRVSMLGPHLPHSDHRDENQFKSSLVRSESVRIKPISENEELRDISFGERSLRRELESIKSETAQKLPGGSQLSDRPKIVVRRRSTIIRK